jgi:hypothetical protein
MKPAPERRFPMTDTPKTVTARRSGTFDGRPIWRAYWRRDAADRWHAVRNIDDQPIAYASRAAALAAADFVREVESRP